MFTLLFDTLTLFNTNIRHCMTEGKTRLFKYGIYCTRYLSRKCLTENGALSLDKDVAPNGIPFTSTVL